MTKEQQQIKDFMIAARQQCPLTPSVVSRSIIELRIKLMVEEMFAELIPAMYDGNIEKIADGIADGMYVLIGTAIAFGLDMEPIFQEVHRSNMTKFIDGTFREDGKYIKGPSYSPANLKQIIEEQMK